MEKKKIMKVVLCEPGENAKIVEIGNELEYLQEAVGGYIETFYPFEEEVCIVCNEEGKYNGMMPSRAIYGKDNKILDIIFGPFIICDCSGEDLGSLTDEQLEKYKNQYENPEELIVVNGEILAVPYKLNE